MHLNIKKNQIYLLLLYSLVQGDSQRIMSLAEFSMQLTLHFHEKKNQEFYFNICSHNAHYSLEI